MAFTSPSLAPSLWQASTASCHLCSLVAACYLGTLQWRPHLLGEGEGLEGLAQGASCLVAQYEDDYSYAKLMCPVLRPVFRSNIYCLSSIRGLFSLDHSGRYLRLMLATHAPFMLTAAHRSAVANIAVTNK